MLLKINRLTKDNDYKQVFQKGFSSYDKIIGLKLVKSNLNNSRFGIIVSTKVSKKAVDRNKIKRRIREAVKGFLGKLKYNADCVIIALPDILGKKSPDINNSILNHFKKLKIL